MTGSVVRAVFVSGKRRIQNLRYGGKALKQTNKLENILIKLYLILILVVYPFFFLNNYSDIGNSKNLFYRSVTVVFLFAVCLLPGKMKVDIRSFSKMDDAMILFGVSSILAFVICADKAVGLNGAYGWNMGLVTEMLMIGTYFVISRKWKPDIRMLYAAGIAAALVFVLGILNRFSIDPLGMLADLEQEKELLFLSTIGQATWYSAFLCVTFPMGLSFFFLEKEKKKRIAAAAFCIISSATLVTQNSDSAFFALGVVLLVLGWQAFRSYADLARYFEVLMLISGTFGLVGIMQKVLSQSAVRLDRLSAFFSQSIWIWCVFVLAVGCRLLLRLSIIRALLEKMNLILIRNVLYVLIGLTIVALFVFIILNASGLTEELLGSSIGRGYFRFDDSWGNNRGFLWKFSMKMYLEEPLVNQLIGVGPDSYVTRAYQLPEYVLLLRTYGQGMWKDAYVMCAHCEPLNMLICQGICGLAAFGMIFVVGIGNALRWFHANSVSDRDDAGRELLERRMLTYGIALCMVSYLAHNIFCYSLIVSTPLVFLLAGMGESIYRGQNR